MIEEILKHNREFVASRAYEKYVAEKYPNMHLAIVTCMDTRLVHLLEDALGLKQGDAKIIKNAGGMIDNPYDSCMRSILVAVYELGVTEVMIIGHTGCGVQGMDPDEMLHLMRERGVSQDTLDMLEHYSAVDIKRWLTGFEDTEQAVRDSVELVKHHPMLPTDVSVSGYIIDTVTGELSKVD